jgi:carbon-monoxide dehydrogenase iron sulfur subunit
MSKILMIHPDKCTGCRNCELACSFKQEEDFRPGASNVHVFTWEREGFSVPMVCQQCDDPACLRVCPTGAMYRNADMPNVVQFDPAACIGCKMCVIACPFGCVNYDSTVRSITKCDTCAGAPECVAFCPNGALEYVEDGEQTRARKKAFASKFKDVFTEVR